MQPTTVVCRLTSDRLPSREVQDRVVRRLCRATHALAVTEVAGAMGLLYRDPTVAEAARPLIAAAVAGWGLGADALSVVRAPWPRLVRDTCRETPVRGGAARAGSGGRQEAERGAWPARRHALRCTTHAAARCLAQARRTGAVASARAALLLALSVGGWLWLRFLLVATAGSGPTRTRLMLDVGGGLRGGALSTAAGLVLTALVLWGPHAVRRVGGALRSTAGRGGPATLRPPAPPDRPDAWPDVPPTFLDAWLLGMVPISFVPWLYLPSGAAAPAVFEGGGAGAPGREEPLGFLLAFTVAALVLPTLWEVAGWADRRRIRAWITADAETAARTLAARPGGRPSTDPVNWARAAARAVDGGFGTEVRPRYERLRHDYLARYGHTPGAARHMRKLQQAVVVAGLRSATYRRAWTHPLGGAAWVRGWCAGPPEDVTPLLPVLWAAVPPSEQLALQAELLAHPQRAVRLAALASLAARPATTRPATTRPATTRPAATRGR